MADPLPRQVRCKVQWDSFAVIISGRCQATRETQFGAQLAGSFHSSNSDGLLCPAPLSAEAAQRLSLPCSWYCLLITLRLPHSHSWGSLPSVSRDTRIIHLHFPLPALDLKEHRIPSKCQLPRSVDCLPPYRASVV